MHERTHACARAREHVHAHAHAHDTRKVSRAALADAGMCARMHAQAGLEGVGTRAKLVAGDTARIVIGLSLHFSY